MLAGKLKKGTKDLLKLSSFNILEARKRGENVRNQVEIVTAILFNFSREVKPLRSFEPEKKKNHCMVDVGLRWE
jgi:hypothetical protein